MWPRILVFVVVCVTGLTAMGCSSESNPCTVADGCVSQCAAECSDISVVAIACEGNTCTCECAPSGSGGGGAGGTAGSGGMAGSGGTAGGGGMAGGRGAGVLIISEYVEGSGFNKAIEVTNVGDPLSSVSLGECVLERYTNGSTVPTTISFAALSLGGGESYAVCNGSIADASGCDALESAINHNGNDAYVLACDGAAVDSFGQVGVDPGSFWESSSGGYGTQDDTLRRLCTVSDGDAVSDDNFTVNLDEEWEGFGADVLSGLGSHDCP